MAKMREVAGIVALLVVLGATTQSLAADGGSYSFAVTRVDHGTVHFRGGDGPSKWTVSYNGGPFRVVEGGVAGVHCSAALDEKPGLVVELKGDDRVLELTCEASRCEVSGDSSDGAPVIRKLRRGKSVEVSAHSGVAITVVR